MKKNCFLILYCLAFYSLTVHGQEVDQIERLYQQGLHQIEEQQWEIAKKTFETILFLDAKHAKSYFQLGKISVELEQNELAEQHLKKAIDLDSDFAAAYHALGVLYLKQGSLEGRLKATPLLLKAAAMDQPNNEFLTDLAILRKEQDLWNYAFSLLEKVIKRDSTHIRELTTLAELYELRWLQYLGTIKMEEVDRYVADGRQEVVMLPIPMHPWANEDLLKAIESNQKIISLEPDNRDALYRQGLIFYELGKPDKLIEQFSKIVEQNPNDKDGHLFLGLGYHQLSEFEKAYHEFMQAKKLMDHDELAMLESLPCFASSKESAQFLCNSHNYWISKDPLFITDYNERELEHYSRLAYANIRFSIPRSEIIGWKTDRGEAFIRYGKPKYRTRIMRDESIQEPMRDEFAAIDRDAPPNLPISEKVTKITPAREMWKYADFILAFKDPTGSNNFLFSDPIPISDKLKFIERMEGLINEVPETYENPYNDNFIPIVASCVDFRGRNGKTLVEIGFGLPLNKLSSIIEQNIITLYLTQGIFFFNANWDEGFKQVKDRTFQRRVGDEYSDTLDVIFIEGDKCFIEPGKYHFAFEIKDNNSDKLARIQQELEILSYQENKLQLSGIQLAYSIKYSESQGNFVKNGLYILPNPGKKYRTNQTVHIYFEIYNLNLDKEGKSKFIIETSIRSAEPKGKLITEMLAGLGKLLGIREQSGVVTLSYEYQGNSQDEFLHTSLDIHELSPADYELHILVRDENTNKQATRSTNFIVLED